jgi:hypothetical protein
VNVFVFLGGCCRKDEGDGGFGVAEEDGAASPSLLLGRCCCLYETCSWKG